MAIDEGIQTRLLAPAAQRGRAMASPFHHVAILKSLPGELNALSHVDARLWAGLTPLIEVATKMASDGTPPQRSGLPNLAARLALAVGDHEILLDPHWVPSGASILVGTGARRRAVSALAHVLRDCEARGVAFVPVIYPGANKRRTQLTREAMDAGGRGVCIRLPLTEVAWGSTEEIDAALGTLLTSLEVDAKEVDLLLDAGYLPPDGGLESADVVRLIEELDGVTKWRSLIVAATVIPQFLTGFPEDAITPIPRRERNLWEQTAALRPRRLPTYGDYGVQHPMRPNKTGPGMRANIRYTTDGAILIARGKAILEFGYEQYRDLASMLVARREYAGPRFSWGDDRLLDCARGNGTPSGQEHWRAVGTSHHLRHVATELARARA
jgi:hypothetical protein